MLMPARLGSLQDRRRHEGCDAGTWLHTHAYVSFMFVLCVCLQSAATSRLGTSEESITPRKIRVMRELRDELLRRYM